ncbi:MAG TPA: NAD-dependent epimerase/dehydratase family protein, partial [Alphaproteobacteria bacterium]|nr:NAD-dependent epimerase/dehydratase family protein [Alphaproteobacteria bacterium]
MGRIVVTGGAGLIGSVLGRKLLDAGHSLLVLDSFQYSYALIPSPDFRWDIDFRVNHLLQGARIERCSTIEAARMRALLEDFSPDCVIHLAAIPLVEVATRHRESAVGSLLTGLTNILEIVRSSNSVARFVYASSSMVYGNFDIDPMPETG